MAETAVAVVERPIDLALLKAVGLDKLAPEQRQLALHIAERYELDLMLKHLVMIEGRPYITRDGLLHVAHRSGLFDGIEASPAEIIDGYWRSTCSVYRKDMTRPFTYTGRYPTSGGNQKYAPEMAIKVGEVMALRRAFDVTAPVYEERWENDDQTPEAEAPKPLTLAERAAAKAEAITSTVSSGPVLVETIVVDQNSQVAEPEEPEPDPGTTHPAASQAPVFGDVNLIRSMRKARR
jgi:hypothetical protein